MDDPANGPIRINVIYMSIAFKSRGFKKAGNSLRKLAVTGFSNAYARSGFVFQNIYVGTSTKGDATCESPTSVYGEAVNRCHHHESFSYKYQIVSGIVPLEITFVRE